MENTKQKIVEIITHSHKTPFEQADEILSLFGGSSRFISVMEQEPPHNIELLAKSPTGVVHLCSWRPAYNIFTCQHKSENSWDWSWKLI